MIASSIASFRTVVILCGVAVLMGCSASQPQSTVSRNPVSGITSNNGGGMAQPNFGSAAPVRVP